MDSGTVDSPVTLVIKAPNQKYNDQTINCFLNWTVEKLKSHISIVYPSKPFSKDQRLVYSGKLLQDHLQLKDVLRKQDEYHMMHLVCASRSPPASPTPPRPSSPTANASSSSSNSEDAGSASLAGSANQAGPPTAPSTSVPGGSDGLRYRGGFPQSGAHITPAAGAMPWPQGTALPPQAGLGPTSGPHTIYTPMQVLWWQQMYARQYYMQYQAAVAAAQPTTSAAPLAPPGPAPSPPQMQPAPPNERMPAALGPNAAAPNPLPENPPANANIQMNAQGGAVLNDDELNRDWLDRLYGVSRAGVLLGIVYFYSSFSRFVMVLGAMLLVYLHQAGWFPFRAEQQQDPGAGHRDAAPRGEAERHRDLQEMERLMDEGMEDNDGEEEEGGGAGEGDEEQSQAQAAVQQPGFLTSAWSFISTFFTSLVPEGQPQPVN
ncbi:homocysteine-responsive endoplasmic reticulum-resident ubiquitin-like domain member 2 protein [Gadus macrocephalus]|uniref:homocysteine-responsive endoplasmic reticulum-resident ubiquitin-like domain member 2 protein n=1 Tax=Gadus macrocephalus TaxID=80720 RepID=UPI0028CB2B0C|nr:homocysteine-responsive endoplasmic reticulum-resident ubiquitin-like domain member 2 protein [Gadus macrocephalus]XP_059921843.1 homocysteine-responsive endoplasmic reticulum-resident ubiquitin-like domain member 2 protein [Gadus macrocephalus]XP_059921844.1 homocysteine-responsive endoplasmic reticulum-resident ubiquitin-like domain member 2 protein [Gadus macrocephalus]